MSHSSSESRSPLKLALRMLISPLWTRIRALHPKPPGRWGAFLAQGELRLALTGACPGTKPYPRVTSDPACTCSCRGSSFAGTAPSSILADLGGLSIQSVHPQRNGECLSLSQLCYQAHYLVLMTFFFF